MLTLYSAFTAKGYVIREEEKEEEGEINLKKKKRKSSRSLAG